MNIFLEVKGRVDIVDVATRYGIKLDRSLKAKCPIHNEKTPSFKIYKNTQTFKCFGCGASGDVISLVSKLFNVEPKRAVEILDGEFRLNVLNKPRKITRYEQIIRNKKKYNNEKSKENYWKVLDEWKRLDDNKRKYKPKNTNDELHELFIEALQKLSYQEYLLDLAEVRYGKY